MSTTLALNPTTKTKSARSKPQPSKALKPGPRKSPTGPSTIAVSTNKKSQLLELLHSSTGASLAELTNISGWQAHSVRGYISGVLRKRLGLIVTLTKDLSGERRYRIKSDSAEDRNHAAARVTA